MSEFRGEMKTLVQTYVELLYPDDLEMQVPHFLKTLPQAKPPLQLMKCEIMWLPVLRGMLKSKP